MRYKFATRHLRKGEAAELAELEKAAWLEPLQAPLEKINKRIELGHCIMVAERDGELIASVSYVPTAEDPYAWSTFPKTFEAFSLLPASQPSCCVYVYNLCVRPDCRDGAVVRGLMRAGILDSISLGARNLVADGRCPAYSGSVSPPDRVDADDVFRKAIDNWRTSGVKPDDRELLRDPVLRFYRRLLDCRFLYLIPDFIPEDIASGGNRVIFVADLTKVKLGDEHRKESV